jgi:ketosteroid isomerase-like protein
VRTTNAAFIFHAYYELLEAGRVAEAVEFFTPTARMHFPNSDWVVGRDAIRAVLEQMTVPFESVHHEFSRVFDGDYPTVCAEGVVSHVLPDGSTVAVGGSMFCEFDGEKIAEQRIYVDLSPVFAAVMAVAGGPQQ